MRRRPPRRVTSQPIRQDFCALPSRAELVGSVPGAGHDSSCGRERVRAPAAASASAEADSETGRRPGHHRPLWPSRLKRSNGGGQRHQSALRHLPLAARESCARSSDDRDRREWAPDDDGRVVDQPYGGHTRRSARSSASRWSADHLPPGSPAPSPDREVRLGQADLPPELEQRLLHAADVATLG